MAKELSFRHSLVVYMPYLLLKFLIKEDCLHKFVDTCLHTGSPANLFYVWNMPKQYDIWEIQKTALKKCMSDVIVFNNYWLRRYWAFEKFLDDYEKAHSK